MDIWQKQKSAPLASVSHAVANFKDKMSLKKPGRRVGLVHWHHGRLGLAARDKQTAANRKMSQALRDNMTKARETEMACAQRHLDRVQGATINEQPLDTPAVSALLIRLQWPCPGLLYCC